MADVSLRDLRNHGGEIVDRGLPRLDVVALRNDIGAVRERSVQS